jgi:hypothetical protein
MANSKFKLTGHDIRAISVAGHLDPRTIQKALLGGDVRPLAAHRIRATAASLGLLWAFPQLETAMLGTVADPDRATVGSSTEGK